MPVAASVQAAGGRESSSQGVIDLGAGHDFWGAIYAACNKDQAIVQQSRRMIVAGGSQGASGSKTPGSKVIEFRARQSNTTAISSSNQDHAVVQQRRCRTPTSGTHTPRGGEYPRGRIVQLGTGKVVPASVCSPHDQDLSVVQKCCRVTVAGGIQGKGWYCYRE